jgi:hypothetical protein
MLWLWLQLVPHTGWRILKRYFETPRGIKPRGRRATCRLSRTTVKYECCEWFLPLHVATCQRRNFSQRNPMTTPSTVITSIALMTILVTPPHPPRMLLVLEKMALINARLDSHANESATHRQRDALCDKPRLVHTTPPVELPHPPPLPQFGHPDPYFLAGHTDHHPGGVPPMYGGPQVHLGYSPQPGGSRHFPGG